MNTPENTMTAHYDMQQLWWLFSDFLRALWVLILCEAKGIRTWCRVLSSLAHMLKGRSTVSTYFIAWAAFCERVEIQHGDPKQPYICHLG
jgi:hypothetical protein